MRGGGDVKKNHLIRPLRIVADSQLDRVAHIFQAAGFSLAELDAAGDLSSMDIQAGDDTSGEHVKK
jgi:hypothetical protein